MASVAKASPEVEGNGPIDTIVDVLNWCSGPTMAKMTPFPSPSSPCAPLKKQYLNDQTPQSQASTAPSTPFSSGLMSPPALPRDFGSLMRQATPEHAASDFQGEFHLGSMTSQDENESGTDLSTAAAEDSVDDAECQEVVVDDFAQVTCFGTPELKSELGRWAQALVQAQEWLEEKQSLQYIVDAPLDLQVLSPGGVAFRRSQNFSDRDNSMEGPSWGTTVFGIDLGDGWLKIPAENRFLPMSLKGRTIVKLAASNDYLGEALVDGPALTPDGKAVDLDGGAAIFFSSAKDLAPSRSTAEQLKEDMRMRRAVEVAHAACDGEARVDSEEACCLDAFGVVHGALPTASSFSTDRQKRFFRRRQLRGGHWRTQKEQPILCTDGRGQVSIYLNLRDSRAARTSRLQDVRRRAAAAATRLGVATISADGVIQDTAELYG